MKEFKDSRHASSSKQPNGYGTPMATDDDADDDDDGDDDGDHDDDDEDARVDVDGDDLATLFSHYCSSNKSKSPELHNRPLYMACGRMESLCRK